MRLPRIGKTAAGAPEESTSSAVSPAVMAKPVTRRSLLQSMAAPSVAALVLPGAGWAQRSQGARSSSPDAALDLPVLRQPDLVSAFAGDGEPQRYPLLRKGDAWTGQDRAAGIRVRFRAGAGQASVSIEAPMMPMQRVHLRWKRRFTPELVALGDAWERSYGDLEWRPLQAERVLPWYALLHGKGRTSGLGVKTGAASFAFWQIDVSGISLWLDVRNGGEGVRLGERMLEAATIVQCEGASRESAFAVTQRLCRAMAEGTAVATERGGMPLDVIFGSNDWYYAYGRNTPEGILRDADLVGSLAPVGGPKPFTVIDDGYQDRSRFPDLPRLAAAIRSRDVLPGVWIRPLRAPATARKTLLLPDARSGGAGREGAPRAFDPTIPEGLQAIAATAVEACAWGFELIKHDFTTYELFGQWGSEAGASPTRGSWHFADPTLTNAEVVTALYRQLRKACGEERVILGCNTVGHLSVGHFDASRTGDDVSGREWERTRRMGVNTLAFRSPQHRVFYAIDADCVPVTSEVPWSMTEQWLRAVADSGSVLLLSPDPKAVGVEQKRALREAFARCAQRPSSEPLDWMESRTPASWRAGGATREYAWILDEGESPFPIGIQRGPD